MSARSSMRALLTLVGMATASAALAQAPAAPAPDSYVGHLIETARTLLEPGDTRDPARASRALDEAAQIGDPDAMEMLADLYMRGDGVDADPARAEELLLRAASLGRTRTASFALGMLYNQPGPLHSPAKASVSFDTAAAAGNSAAMVELARLLIAGGDVPVDLPRARQLVTSAIANDEVASGAEVLGDILRMPGPDQKLWQAAAAYRRAADAGNADAMLKLASMVAVGQGYARSPILAQRLIETAIASGHESAGLEALGDFYMLPAEFHEEKLAAEAYEKAADAGNGAAMLKLAALYVDGRGVTASFSRARQTINRAIDAGEVAAGSRMLGDLYRAPGPNQDFDAAAKAYQAAADAGDTTSMVRLAHMLWSKTELPVDYSRATLLLEQAISAGDFAAAGEEMGDLYIASDINRAIGGYQKAADAGNASAAIKLARIFMGTDAGEPRFADAEKLLQRAADAGSADAWEALGDLRQTEGSPLHDVNGAASAYGKAAAAGSAAAAGKLAVMLADRKDLPADYDRAIGLFRQAVAGGEVMPSAEWLGGLYLNYPPPGNPKEARHYFEIAAEAGSGRADLEVARLASPGYAEPVERRVMVDHLRSAAERMDPKQVAIAMMQLDADALLAATQQMLADAGLRVAVDSQHGPQTRNAIATFCKRRQLSCETTFITLELLEALLTDRRA